MAQLLIVISLDLAKIICYWAISVFIIVFLLIGFIWLSCIDCISRNEAFLTSLVLLIILAMVFLFFSLRLYRKLWVVKKLLISQFWTQSLTLFRSRVLYKLIRGLTFGHKGVYQFVILVVILVKVTISKALNLCLGLAWDSYFDQGVLLV